MFIVSIQTFMQKNISLFKTIFSLGWRGDFNTLRKLAKRWNSLRFIYSLYIEKHQSYIPLCADISDDVKFPHLSGIYITLYRQQAWIFLQLFVATASFEEIEVLGKKIRPLVLWGQLVGIGEPGSATQFEGKLKIKVSSVNTYLTQGTQFRSRSTGLIYYTTETILLRNDWETVKVKCAESGIIGNLVVGDFLDTVSPYYNIDRQAECAEVLIDAVDNEDESSYRARVESRWRIQPQGGALNDYRKWASEVPGVYQTYIYKDDETAAGVIIYVVANHEYLLKNCWLKLEKLVLLILKQERVENLLGQ